MADWIDELFEDGQKLDWKEQSYIIYLIEDSTLSDDEIAHYKEMVVHNDMTSDEIVNLKSMLKLNRRTPFERSNMSATEINEIVKNKLNDE